MCKHVFLKPLMPWFLGLDRGQGPGTPTGFGMNRDGILKHILAAMVIAVVFYFATFWWIEARRVAHGPWQITFASDAAGTPSLAISELKLNISQTVRFPGDKTKPGVSQTFTFRQETPVLPFGEIVFQDPTFLPGTVSMRIYGHKVELVPRVLYIDGKEHKWGATNMIDVR